MQGRLDIAITIPGLTESSTEQSLMLMNSIYVSGGGRRKRGLTRTKKWFILMCATINKVTCIRSLNELQQFSKFVQPGASTDILPN